MDMTIRGTVCDQVAMYIVSTKNEVLYFHISSNTHCVYIIYPFIIIVVHACML